MFAQPILLPPAREQERIVAKLNEALPGLTAGIAAAKRAQERLHPYRAATLRDAVTGELTRDWREIHKPDETGAQLLQRILKIRRARWEEAELQRLSTTGNIPKNDSWKLRYVEPTTPETTGQPQLPREWAWASLDMIAEIGAGVAVSRGRILNDPVELSYLRVANVLRGKLDLSETKTIRIDRDQVKQYLLHKGDLLFNEGGDRDKLGRGWVWEGQLPNCIHQNHVFRARLFDQALVNPYFVSHWGNTFGQEFFIQHATQTVNLASINRDVLTRLPVPIPPGAEQGQIILDLERRLLSADSLAASLKKQLAACRALVAGLFCDDDGLHLKSERAQAYREHACTIRQR